MVLGGEMFSAAEAKAEGLSTQWSRPARSCRRRATTPRGSPAAGRRRSKYEADDRLASGEDKGAAVEALGSILVAKTGDLKEGVAAFSESVKLASRRMVMTAVVRPKALGDYEVREFRMLIDGQWVDGAEGARSSAWRRGHGVVVSRYQAAAKADAERAIAAARRLRRRSVAAHDSLGTVG